MLPLFARNSIYESLAKSHLNFGNLIYGACKINLLKELESTQNKLLRNLTNKKYNCHADPLYKKTGQHKAAELIKINQSIFVKKHKKNVLPATLDGL